MAVVSQGQNADKERLGNFATSSPGVRLVGTVRAVLVGSDHVDTISPIPIRGVPLPWNRDTRFGAPCGNAVPLE